MIQNENNSNEPNPGRSGNQVTTPTATPIIGRNGCVGRSLPLIPKPVSNYEILINVTDTASTKQESNSNGNNHSDDTNNSGHLTCNDTTNSSSCNSYDTEHSCHVNDTPLQTTTNANEYPSSYNLDDVTEDDYEPIAFSPVGYNCPIPAHSGKLYSGNMALVPGITDGANSSYMNHMYHPYGNSGYSGYSSYYNTPNGYQNCYDANKSSNATNYPDSEVHAAQAAKSIDYTYPHQSDNTGIVHFLPLRVITNMICGNVSPDPMDIYDYQNLEHTKHTLYSSNIFPQVYQVDPNISLINANMDNASINGTNLERLLLSDAYRARNNLEFDMKFEPVIAGLPFLDIDIAKPNFKHMNYNFFTKVAKIASISGRGVVNLKERIRTSNLNEAYNSLREVIPTIPETKKLTKIEIVRLAMSYIAHLGIQIRFGDQFTNCSNCVRYKKEIWHICPFCKAPLAINNKNIQKEQRVCRYIHKDNRRSIQ